MADYRLKELKIEVNRDCPLNCLHCSSNGMPKAPERLNPSKVIQLIKEFVSLGGEKVCISGGEPLCYSELPDIIKACVDINLNISLYTTGIIRNGSPSKPMSEKMAAFLADSHVKTIFSLHGAYEHTHDKLTQVRGSFYNTLTAIKRAQNAGALVELHVVPTAINFKELQDIARLAESYNLKKISWLRLVPQGRGQINKDILQLNKNQVKQLIEIKEEIKQDYPSITIRTGAPFNILCPEKPAECEAGISVLTIKPDGYIAPCDAFKRFSIPDEYDNVLRHSLYDIWNYSYFLNLVRTIHNSKSTSSCTSCSLYSTCNSGCIAQKAIIAGKLVNGRDPLCPLSTVEVVRGEVETVTVR